jgi:transposase
MLSQDVSFVGVDVSKADLEVRDLAESRSRRCKNSPQGWKALIERLRDRSCVVGVEPSGGYERGLVRALVEAGVEVRWTDPVRVRALAKALGIPAKTDAIDAELIARFVAHGGGRRVELHPEREALRDLFSARSAAQETATRLKSQADALEDGVARQALKTLEAQAREQIRRLTKMALELIQRSRLAEDWKRLQSAPGIAGLSGAELLVHLPELGQLSRKAIARLVGLAPYTKESGAWRGRAHCSGGRPRPRQLLFLAAMAAVKMGAIKPRYERLIANGKPRMVALTACMRHHLTALNAMIRDQTPWSQQLV